MDPLDAKDADVVYTFVDLGLSLNGLLGYRLPNEMQNLFRYINADLLYGLKRMGITFMSKKDLIFEFMGAGNTVAGQYNSY